MSESTSAELQHPVLRALAGAQAALGEVAAAQPVFMSVDDKAAALLLATTLGDQVAELGLRVLAEAGDVAAAEGMRDPAAWLAHHGRLDARETRRRHHLAAALDAAPLVREGLREGTVNTAQAEVIVRALDALPAQAGPEVRDLAAGVLVEKAGEFGPRELRILGRRILEVVAPDLVDDAERKALEDEEREAARKSFLRFRRNGDGTTDIRLRVPDAVADRLRVLLDAYTNPRHQAAQRTADQRTADQQAADQQAADQRAAATDDSTDEPETTEPTEAEADAEVEWWEPVDNPPDPPEPPAEAHTEEADTAGQTGLDDTRSHSRRLADAFASLLEHLDPRRLPLHGGDATTVFVTIDHHTLTEQLTSLGLLGDEPITPGHARRLLCNARIIPAVLGTNSEILDLGRTTRLYNPPQRRAMALRDRTCRAHGCHIPAPGCEAHHWHPWSLGGPTDLTHGGLLCPYHHHLAHDPHYTVHTDQHGRVHFRRADPPRAAGPTTAALTDR